MAPAVSSPIPLTRSNSWREAARIRGASPKYSSNCRTRTGPTLLIRLRATRASRVSIPGLQMIDQLAGHDLATTAVGHGELKTLIRPGGSKAALLIQRNEIDAEV